MPKRKIHKNSLANLQPKAASKGGKVRKNLSLLPGTYELAQKIGDRGYASDGIDRLFRQLPAFRKCREMLTMIAENPEKAAGLVDVIEALLLDMEDMEIEQIGEEAIAEGVIKTPSGSWIV